MIGLQLLLRSVTDRWKDHHHHHHHHHNENL